MRSTWIWTALLAIALLLVGRAAAAADCEGPAECCVTKVEDVKQPLPTRVRLGLRVMRIGKIDEQEGNHAAEITLTSK